jgi:hypothetical protein
MVEIARPIWSAIAIRHNHGKLNNKQIVEIADSTSFKIIEIILLQ